MKKFLIFCFILFIFLFGHIYQKVKIVILAYKIHNSKMEFDNLVEEKSDFVYNFYKEANLVAINERITSNELELHYPRKYIRVTTQDSSIQQQKPPSQSLLAKIFTFSSQVEARP
jgi:hypothetical protein